MIKDASPTLGKVQTEMARELLRASRGSHVHQNWLAEQMDLTNIAPIMRNDQAVARMNVYRNNVMFSLTQAMTKQFPVVATVVGEKFFLALARDYLQAHPPEEPELTFIGQTFPEFITSHPHCEQLPYLADLARLEWHCQRALHSVDDPVLAPEELANIDPELLGDQILTLHDSAILLQSDFPVSLIWQEHSGDNPSPIDLVNAPSTHALIYRKGFVVNVVTLAQPAFDFLQVTKKGASISQSWESISSKYAMADEEFPKLFGFLMSLQVFSGLMIVNT